LTSIELRHISNYILNDINLRVDSKELMVILGPNGAGKTTLLNVIAGLTKYNGNVILDGKVADNLPPYKRNIGYVPQSLALFPHMNVYNNVAYGLKIRGFSKAVVEEKVKETMKMLGIWKLRDKYPKKLSGGEQQRVAIARALVTEPNILLLDEPFNNLQISLRKALRLEVKEIQRKLGLTTIFVTHDIDEAEEVGDRIAVIDRGRLLSVGSYIDVLPAISSAIYKLNIFKGRIVEVLSSGLAKVLCGDLQLLVPVDDYHSNVDVTVTISPYHILISNVKPNIEFNTFKGKIYEVKDKGHYYEIIIKVKNTILSAYINHENFENINLDSQNEIYVKIPIRYIKASVNHHDNKNSL